MNTSTFGFGEKNGLKSSEYTNLFGDPFWGEAGSLKARNIYLQLNEKEKALMLKANYLKMIEKSRERNFNMAADCLQWWLDGTGFTKNINFHWLRKQREVISAENVNIERFEKDEDSKLGIFLLTLQEGKKGASAYIYGLGNIGDSEALLVEKYCGAKPFEMRSQWKQNFKKTFQSNSSRDLNLKLK